MKKTCPSCGGTGQLSYFQGVSRFLLTTEECQECHGTGYVIENKNERNKDSDKPEFRQEKK